MEQHPIPQNVSSYQFKLVGDMTLKQFFELAGGLLVGFIFYSLPILAVVKWPLAIISAILGIGMAFFPLEERPLERWIFAFFRAIYSPTLFTWKKTEKMPNFYRDEPSTQPIESQAVNEYLATTIKPSGVLGNLENAEKGFLSRITETFSSVASSVLPFKSSPPSVQTSGPAPTGNVLSQTVVGAIPTQPQSVPEKKEDILIPQTPAISVEHTANPKYVVEERENIPLTTHMVSPIVAGNEMVSAKQAIFSVDAAPPSPPTIPNVIVGQVVDQDRKIIEGAIMEIRDSQGRPIRALRSNKVGHFITVTPLDNGIYQIITDKDGYQFAPVSFDAAGALIPPILVSGVRVMSIEDMPAVKNAYSIN